MNSSPLVVVTGIKPTGRLHLGNYLGMIRPALALAKDNESYVFIADGHAMTTERDPATLAAQTQDLAAALLALGFERTALYRQSGVPEVFELTWVLACSTPKGLLNRAHAYKAVVDANRRSGRPADDGVSAGLYAYPVLMAADILALGATVVPVGADQAQHLEITRDLATAFNREYDPAFIVPEAVVDDDVAVIPGTDGRKMSKSYGNDIPIFAEPAEMARHVRSIVTDSRRPEDPKDPEACHVFSLYRHLGDPAAVRALAERYRAGGVGYGEVKGLLLEALEERFGEARRRYRDFLSDPAGLEKVLVAGAVRARTQARLVLDRVRRARGLAA